MTDIAGSRMLAGSHVVPIVGIAARLVVRMEESLSVPTATSYRDVPVAELTAQRTRLNLVLAPRRLSFTHLIGYAVAQAATVHPGMAAFFQSIDGKPHRIEPARIGLGIAVDTQQRDGSHFLIVPVIARVDELTFAEFVAAFDDLIERTRTGHLKADDLVGATMTLTNPGTVGTTASVPRLMTGQGSIIATGAIRGTGGDQLMTISSTYDHRIIQGADSGRFLATVDDMLQGTDDFYDDVASSLGVTPPPTLAGQLSSRADRPLRAGPTDTATPAGDRNPRSSAPQDPVALADVAAGMALVRSYREFGHRAARLDPLGSDPPGDPSLDLATSGLSADALDRVPAAVLGVDVAGSTLGDVLAELRRIYCGTSAFEIEHLSRHAEREWLQRVIESGEFAVRLEPETKLRLLRRLTAVEALEQFLQRAYLGQKRFSIEGLDVLVPMVDELVERVAEVGARTVEIGMTHRGRLNVLAHIVGVSYATILADFERSRPTAEAELPLEGSTSDVKYHRGADGVYQSASGPLRITVSPNPSHLEAIGPVVEGRARAEQTNRSAPGSTRDASVAVPMLIHGDAAFAAQGVVAETFNLARLEGYTTGGTVHLIANNQLGFTVEPDAGRSTDYASDLAKGFDVPIVHVNADDPEACLGAVRLAAAYRARFHADFVIDVVGYRRHGHNEEDEPAYTQPQMYERIGAHPTVRKLYLQRLVSEGVADESAAEAELPAAEASLGGILDSLAEVVPRPEEGADDLSATAARRPARTPRAPQTAVPGERLKAIESELLSWPADFTVHPKLLVQFQRRTAAFAAGKVAWATAEALALGSMLTDGTAIRLTGQDTVRGTFSQRHLELRDVTDGRQYAPIQHLTDARAALELHDSPLSEYACLGFEYGYAVAAPDALVLWEAQYGDFVNGAEVIIDQFLIAGQAKWGQTSRLTLLLPHGYEGQGPEHSSARLERFLALGAEDNVRVANTTTPAQYFHLLRDQARRDPPRPLVLLTPKSLLRLPAATSNLTDLSSGGFNAVIDDPDRSADTAAVKRLVLCSGRLYYDLLQSPRRAGAHDVAIVRVELLYPFPEKAIAAVVARYPRIQTVVWAQEEPRNMGARKFILPKLREIVPAAVPIVDVSRPERSAPAEGYHAAHRAEQARLVGESLGT